MASAAMTPKGLTELKRERDALQERADAAEARCKQQAAEISEATAVIQDCEDALGGNLPDTAVAFLAQHPAADEPESLRVAVQAEGGRHHAACHCGYNAAAGIAADIEQRGYERGKTDGLTAAAAICDKAYGVELANADDANRGNPGRGNHNVARAEGCGGCADAILALIKGEKNAT